MDRRVFVNSVACGAVVAAVAATAQTLADPRRPRRVGWMQGGGPDTPEDQRQVDDALARVGWIVGQNVFIDRRFVQFDDLPGVAAEFVNARADLIIANGTPATLAAKKATRSIPILMWTAADPVAAGLVASLSRPGGNVTGFARQSPEQGVKRLSLLRELVPGIRRVGELDDSTNPGLRVIRKRLEETYRSLGMEAIFIDMTRIAKFDDVLAELVRRRAQALHFTEDAFPENWLPQMLDAAVRISLPTFVNTYRWLEAGALLCYEEDESEQLFRCAVLFDKLLRGVKPAELPVEQPRKFSLGINRKTAIAIGIAIPQSLLLRADRVIQ